MQRFIIGMNLMLIAIALGTAALLDYGYGRAASINRVALDRSLTALPEHAERGERVINVLLVGSDSSARLDEDDPIQIGRRGERFGDVIIIAHLDERTGEIALLSLPRDLWVTVSGTGRESRINRAFELGGPATLIDTIETEFDIPIHHYVNVDFAGFQGLVSAIGSVDVYFETPARDWNVNASPPRSQTGFIVEEAGCRSLDPETALAYVRSRYYQTQNADGDWVTDPTADLGRIRRQQDFLRRVMQQAIDMGARNPFVLRELIDTGLENVAIDERLTPQLLVDVGTTYRSFNPDQLQTYSFPAVDDRVGSNQVLVPLTDAAAPVIALFNGAGFDDPSTVDLTVQVEPDAADSGRKNATGVGARSGAVPSGTDHPADRLEAAGFEVDRTTKVDLAPGVVVKHGPDGRQAADLVLTALTGEASATTSGIAVEQVSWLLGRSVVVAVGPDTAGATTTITTDGGEAAPDGVLVPEIVGGGAPGPGTADGAATADGTNPVPGARASTSPDDDDPSESETGARSEADTDPASGDGDSGSGGPSPESGHC